LATKLPRTDAVIVGMGWAGGIAAAELTKAGLNVVGLERGRGRSIEDYYLSHDELRYAHRHELMQDLSKETFTFRNDMTQTALPMRQMSAMTIGTGVGGSGVHWNGFTHLFLDYDFQIKTKTVERYGAGKIPQDMTIQDWGITEAGLDPYYQKFVEMAGISGEDNHFRPRSWKYPTGPMKQPEKMKLAYDAAAKLGLHPFISPSANLSERYKNADGIERAACQYCSFCAKYGCEYGSKADPVVTVIPVAQQTGKLDLRTHAQVLEVLHDGKKATGVRYLDTMTGLEMIQEADIVVLSAYTYSNTRLMLMSKIGEAYDPATGKGVVGKNYSDHFLSMAFGFFDNKSFNDYMGAGALGISLDDYNGDFFDHSNLDFIHGGMISATQTGNGPIGWNLSPLGTPAWGKEFKKQSLYYSNRGALVFSQSAAMPNRYNYLSLDPTYKDAFGQPLLRMTVNWHQNEHSMHKFMTNRCEEIVKEMGADHIMAFDQMGNYSLQYAVPEHSVGGTIMGGDPATSVVNSYSQVWSLENMFVLGASTFANQSGVNPTGTVGALAYRAAEGILKYSKQGGMLV